MKHLLSQFVDDACAWVVVGLNVIPTLGLPLSYISLSHVVPMLHVHNVEEVARFARDWCVMDV